MDGRPNSYMQDLRAVSPGFVPDGVFLAVEGLSPIKTYAAMAHKTPIQSGIGGLSGHDQSRLPVKNLFPSNMLHSPSFPLMHEYVNGDQGLKSMGGSPPSNAHPNNEDKSHSVSYEEDEDGPTVVIPVNELENSHTQLQDRVVIGLYHGVRPSLESLRVWIFQTWENKNIRIGHAQYLPNGYYLFFCTDANSALQIVSQGQWLIRNTPISVFNWYIGFNPKGPKPFKAPVWVAFINLPIELYPWIKPIGNSLIRVLGQRSRGGINPKFDPQLLIEIDFNKELKYLIPIKDSCGRALHHQKIVYKTLPNACFNCMKMGHFIKDCSDLKPQQPVPDLEKKDDF
ncbi:hypothetical protein L7F22_026359 [Adiantum nelumboides]|nr:hypothetical protein [Adiantum nelumboides]